jgi:hypothetical protein
MCRVNPIKLCVVVCAQVPRNARKAHDSLRTRKSKLVADPKPTHVGESSALMLASSIPTLQYCTYNNSTVGSLVSYALIEVLKNHVSS